MKGGKRFSVIVPVYQNEGSLDETVSQLLALDKRLDGYDLELIFVDDGSTDNSYNMLMERYRENPKRIRVVKLTKNFGQNRALQAGLRQASGDCIGIISADLQDPHELFLDMIEKWENGVKLVIAERNGREEKGLRRPVFQFVLAAAEKVCHQGFPRGRIRFLFV